MNNRIIFRLVMMRFRKDNIGNEGDIYLSVAFDGKKQPAFVRSFMESTIREKTDSHSGNYN